MDKKSENAGLSPFYAELVQILNENVEKTLGDEGIDLSSHPQAQILLRTISELKQGKNPAFLEGLVEDYQRFFKVKPSIHLEKRLLESFSSKDFVDLGLSRYFPRVYRGLPRLYLKDRPSQSHIKKEFTHLPSLKKGAALRSVYSLYSSTLPKGSVLILTWVIDDGLGDFTAGSELFKLLKARFPNLDLHFLALLPEEIKKEIPPLEKSSYIFYPKECSLELVLEHGYELFSKADLVVQIPTLYPFTKELQETFDQAKWESIGEYGFIESSWFHPKTEHHSLGLHFLERGILTRKSLPKSWANIQSEEIKGWRDPKNPFYMAYLSTPIGGAIYLHALLKYLEKDPQDIDLCSADLSWFLQFAQMQKEKDKPLLERDMGISSIQIQYKQRVCEIPLYPKGKKLRILTPSKLSQEDFQSLISLSGDWVGTRGNQSFSEAICEKKVFFYDGRAHSRFFFKDLVAIAENRISNFPSALECIRAMAQNLLQYGDASEGEWVEETYFQEAEDWMTLALKIGFALRDPQTLLGFRKLGQILTEEFSANAFLSHLVQRALYHREYPDVEKEEKEALDLFARGFLSFKDLIERQKEKILNPVPDADRERQILQP